MEIALNVNGRNDASRMNYYFLRVSNEAFINGLKNIFSRTHKMILYTRNYISPFYALKQHKMQQKDKEKIAKVW